MMRRKASADLRNSMIRSSFELLDFVVRDVSKKHRLREGRCKPTFMVLMDHSIPGEALRRGALITPSAYWNRTVKWKKRIFPEFLRPDIPAATVFLLLLAERID
jgi:hypothetical protein